MTYLIDTQTLIWAIMDTAQLSGKVRKIIETPEHQIMTSVVSFWEISLKYALGKLSIEHVLPEDFPSLCEKMDFSALPLDAETCATYHQLQAFYHKDPFDRMLVWQAKCLNVPILSKDEQIRLYESEGISVIW